MHEQEELITEEVKAGVYAAFLARPKSGENLPGVLIIHEIFGLNENIRDIARRFAREGYVALAVDLYSKENVRQLCIFKTVAGMIISARKTAHMGALDEAANWLKNLPGVSPEKLGVIGFCMGGGYALAFAVSSKQLQAVSAFYGMNPRPLDSVAQACPVMASYGSKDQFFAKQGLKLEKKLKEFGIPHDVKVYEDANHAFFNDTWSNYNPEAAKDAWQRTLAFFSEHISNRKK
jgi:carboxymethylenebutenolidase